jgi:hypothetical protein
MTRVTGFFLAKGGDWKNSEIAESGFNNSITYNSPMYRDHYEPQFPGLISDI